MSGFDPNAALQRAMMLQRSGDAAQAAAIYREVVRTAPANAQVLFLLGTAEMQLGRHKEGAAALRKSLQIVPGQPRALCNLGLALRHLGQGEEALASFDRAIALMPDYAIAFNNRGTVLLDFGRIEEALASFERAAAIEPGYAEAHNNRGTALDKLGRRPEALAAFDRAVAFIPDYAVAHHNRGTVLLALCRMDEALAAFDRTIKLTPGDARAHCGRATALFNLKRLDEAAASNERALALDPALAEAQWNKARLLLAAGDLAAGWEYYEARWRIPGFADNPRDLGKPRWDGSQPLAGKTLFVHAEQGYGDAVQCSRYLPLARAAGADVIFEVPQRLLPLMATLKGGVRLIAKGDPLPEFDLFCPVMSLPRAFRTTLKTIPADIPYLSADAARCEAVRTRLGPKKTPRIGLVWSGGPDLDVNLMRSVPLAALAPLLQQPFEFHSLQKEIRPDEAAVLAGLPQLRRHEDEQHDFADAAALIANMDLVITVCTAVAHVAGAMGKPVWVLLHWMADWRWLTDRSDSPWYPTATLFRQKAYGDWAGVVGDVVARLGSRDFSGMQPG